MASVKLVACDWCGDSSFSKQHLQFASTLHLKGSAPTGETFVASAPANYIEISPDLSPSDAA